MIDLAYLSCISILVALAMRLGYQINFKTSVIRFAYIIALGILIYAPYYQLAAENVFDFYLISFDFSDYPGVNLASIIFMIFISKYLPVRSRNER